MKSYGVVAGAVFWVGLLMLNKFLFFACLIIFSLIWSYKQKEKKEVK